MKQDYIKLFANCIPVKGHKQSLIVDLQRGGASNAIPNSLFDIINNYPDKTKEKIKQLYDNEYDEVIEGYFYFLLKNEFAFNCSEEELISFPKLDLTWKSPSIIENAIVDIWELKGTEIKKIVSELSQLRCNALQIRYEKECALNDLKEIGLLLDNTRILSVEVFIKHSLETTVDALMNLVEKFPRYQRVFIYNSPKDEISSCSTICFDTRNITPSRDCGVVSSQHFVVNIETFSESQHFNTCLNRKISIDSQGYIKNCPSMSHNYGHISSIKLQDVVQSVEFQQWWHYKKDDIEVCKDCEFRYICTDCRAFIKDPKNIYSRPLKCTYNPYIAKWEGEDDYISVEDYEANALI